MRVTGTVRARPEGTVNPNLPTGEVEVGDCTVEVLTAAEPPPFPLDDRADDVDESCGCATATSTCAASACSATCASGPTVNSAHPRGRWSAQGFVEVETPMLIAVDARGRARLRRAVAPAARARSTRCRRARSCSSSC